LPEKVKDGGVKGTGNDVGNGLEKGQKEIALIHEDFDRNGPFFVLAILQLEIGFLILKI
jgi:hypothetical protein